jgi:hypothetical protein
MPPGLIAVLPGLFGDFLPRTRGLSSFLQVKVIDPRETEQAMRAAAWSLFDRRIELVAHQVFQVELLSQFVPWRHR